MLDKRIELRGERRTGPSHTVHVQSYLVTISMQVVAEGTRPFHTVCCEFTLRQQSVGATEETSWLRDTSPDKSLSFTHS